MAAYCISPKISDFRGYPFETYTETKTQSFQKNNCSSGQSGGWVEYSKTYTSYLSEQDLQQKIADDANTFNSQGQANANANGTCSSSCTSKTSSGTGALPDLLIGLTGSYLYATPRNNTFPARYPLGTINAGASVGTVSARTNSDYREMMAPSYPELYHYFAEFQSGSNYLIDIYSISPNPNACQGPVNKYLNLQSNGYLMRGLLLYYGLGNSLNGFIYITSRWSTDTTADIYFKSDTGGNVKIATINAPSSGGKKYKFRSGWIAASNNGDVYITMSCKTDSGNSQRIVVYVVTKNTFGQPTGVSQIYSEYSSSSIAVTATGWISNSFVVFYNTDTSHASVTITGASVSSPGFISSFISYGVNAYASTNLGLRRYNLGAWTTLYSY